MGSGAARGVAALSVVLWILGPAPARAADPTARGSVAGELTKGGRATFHVTGTHPDGWQALRTAAVLLELRGVVLDEIVYEVDTTSIEVSGNRAVAGTGNVATGRFFRVRAFGVEASTGGNRLRLTVPASVLEPPPEGARFRFAVESDEGDEASTTVPAAVQEEEGLTFVYVIGAVIAALVAGGFLGSQLSSRRRGSRSVYATVARRLDESERPPPSPDRR
jgi:hypothetical protein